MESVLCPMEPVDPKIANFFTTVIFSECGALVLLMLLLMFLRRGLTPAYFVQSIQSVWFRFGLRFWLVGKVLDYKGFRFGSPCKVFI